VARDAIENRMRMNSAHWRGLAGLALLALQFGCSHPRYYADAEHALTTHAFFSSEGHFAVYYPAEIALQFPGYLVGIEMGERAAILSDADLTVERPLKAGTSMLRLADTLRDGKSSGDSGAETDLVPFVSHVVRYTGQPLGAGNCALYSTYQVAPAELLEFCGGRRLPLIGDVSRYRTAFADSWTAIDTLKQALHHDAAAGRYTHLVVAMMGWRTPQEEAIRNFNSLMRTIHLAAPADFRPLFIGITWVGPWSGRWLDPLVEMAAYGNIADLADTLGLTWVGVLIDDVVLPLSQQLPVTWITHSFGARTATTATCIGPVIRRHAAPRSPVTGRIDRLIGFQAAFSLLRFSEDRRYFYEDVHFPNGCDRAKSIVLTTSKYDTATTTILWADLAGSYRQFKSFCRKNAGTLASCATVDESGAIVGADDPRMKLLYLDASGLIRFRAPRTDGGAHSDIFRPDAGRLIWNLMATPPGSATAAPNR
jgi:hypothetical protein